MVSLPRDISPAARARRSLLADLLCGLVLAIVVILLCAGIGIVGVIALVSFLVLTAWFGAERLARFARRRRARARG